MCQALSNKINAKISRQRLDIRFSELTDAIKQQLKPTTDSDETS